MCGAQPLVQHALAFDMPPYLLGHKGPAQCIHFTEAPMKVHLVPRAGGTPQVSTPVTLDAFPAYPIDILHLHSSSLHATLLQAPMHSNFPRGLSAK